MIGVVGKQMIAKTLRLKILLSTAYDGRMEKIKNPALPWIVETL